MRFCGLSGLRNRERRQTDSIKIGHGTGKITIFIIVVVVARFLVSMGLMVSALSGGQEVQTQRNEYGFWGQLVSSAH